MNEDVYTVGNTDFSSGFWTSFSKYYVVQDNQKWNAVFNLNINPSATNTYKNFTLVITNDVDRGGTGYTEYGAIRLITSQAVTLSGVTISTEAACRVISPLKLIKTRV